MLEALTGDRAVATSSLRRVELPETGKGARSVTEDNLHLTRRTDDGNGDLVAVVKTSN